MPVRLLWNSSAAGDEGAFVLRTGRMFFGADAEGRLQRLGTPPGEDQDALVAHAPDEEGRVLLETHGAMRLRSTGKEFRRVRLPPGGRVVYALDDVEGELTAEGRAPGDDPLVGRTLAGYRVLSRLGSGAVGVVYRALQTNLDREVALKVLNPKVAQSPLAVASFKREAVAAGKLSHANLVQVYDVGHDQGLHFYSMEIVPHGDLEERLREQGPLDWREALACVRDCAAALSFAEEHHLVHRDVKPENLMVAGDERIKLADLGMAATRGMIEKESAGGTPHFMAPECIGGGSVDHRADLYSLGCTLFRLLTGETPYTGKSVKDILRAHRDEPPPSVREHGVEAPAAVDELVAWMMAKDPDERPQSAREVVEECEHLLRGRGSRAVLLGLTAVAVAAVGIAVWFATRPDPEPTDPEQVVVEVESAESLAERARMARELAFTKAMAEPPGPARIEALEAFLAEHGDSAYAQRARDEIARLEALPEDPPESDEDGSGDGGEDEALRERLRVLGEEVDAALDERRFGQAQALVNASALPADLLLPLVGRVQDRAAQAMAQWEADHAQALAAEDWARARSVRAAFEAAIRADTEVPPEWEARLTALDERATEAEERAAREAFREARVHVVRALQEGALPAVLGMDLAAAEDAVRAAAEGCAHEDMAAAVRREVAVFEAAARAAEALRGALDGNGEPVDIVEPREGRRAFALEATAEGIRLLVQVSGERVERLDPWEEFADPQVLSTLLDAALPAEVPASDARALHLLFGEAALARRVQGWSDLPDPAEAAEVSAAVDAWLEHAPRALAAEPDWLPRHRLAMHALGEFADALAAEDPYLALLRGRSLVERFSLLAAWASNGESTWQYRP